MINVTKEELKAYERFLFKRGRDIEIAKFNYYFGEGERSDVALALTIYQNRDGGFGHGLEPDCMNPYSSAAQTNEALSILKHVDYNESNLDETASYVVNRALHYIYYYELKDGKINPNVKSNNDYPHAIWWEYDENFFRSWRYYPTAALVAHTLHFTDPNNKYYQKALPLVEIIIESFKNDESVSRHYINSMCELYEVMVRKNIHSELHEDLLKAINEHIEKIITREKSDFHLNKNATPLELLQFDFLVDSEERRNLINDNLDFLLEQRDSNGLFEINWVWHTDYEEFELQKIKWMGILIVNYLYFFKKYNRIEL